MLFFCNKLPCTIVSWPLEKKSIESDRTYSMETVCREVDEMPSSGGESQTEGLLVLFSLFILLLEVSTHLEIKNG